MVNYPRLKHLGFLAKRLMKKVKEEPDSVKDYGYSKEVNAAIEMGVKNLMKGLGLSREEAEKASSDS